MIGLWCNRLTRLILVQKIGESYSSSPTYFKSFANNTMDDNIIVVAHKKGYRVDATGGVYYKGRKLNPMKTKPAPNRLSYFNFTVRDMTGQRRKVLVHRLMTYQKYGNKMFDKGIIVRHLNNNSLDNSYENIAIGTQHDNMMDMPAARRLARAIHASSFLKKYDTEKVKQFYKSCKSYAKTMREFNIPSKGTVFYIINKQ